MTNNFIKMNKKCAEYRGTIIQEFSYLEDLIEVCITAFFCKPHRAKDFFEVLMAATDKITFNTKFGILGYIIKNYYPDFLVKNPDYLTELSATMRIRNIVAHRKFEPTDQDILDYDGNTICLKWTITHKNKIKYKTEKLNKEIVKKICNDIEKLRKDTGRFFDLYKPDQ